MWIFFNQSLGESNGISCEDLYYHLSCAVKLTLSVRLIILYYLPRFLLIFLIFWNNVWTKSCIENEKKSVIKICFCYEFIQLFVKYFEQFFYSIGAILQHICYWSLVAKLVYNWFVRPNIEKWFTQLLLEIYAYFFRWASTCIYLYFSQNFIANGYCYSC